MNRYSILPLLGVIALSATAKAETAGTFAPWMDTTSSTQATQIKPEPITLEDLENNFQPSKQADTPPSRIEDLYAERIVDELHQFGYNLFDNTKTTDANKSIPTGNVSNDYVLSAGDQLKIITRGQVNAQQTYEINQNGMLIVDDFSPIMATGTTLGQIKKLLQDEATNLHNTEIYVSLSGVRQINILVVGHVNKPGRHAFTTFHSVLDALIGAGGIDKTGSMRRIKLVRQGKSHIIDLYQLLMMNGGSADKPLQDGDRIIVPPIGSTVAISGHVKRPAIYEIRKGEKLSLHQALGLSGGVLTPGDNRFVRLEYTNDGRETVREIKSPKQRSFGDGSILSVSQAEKKRTESITLSGHTRQPGTHDLNQKKTLAALINNEKVLGKDIYPLIGIIERQNTSNLSKELIAFSPFRVLQKKENVTLNNNDQVHLFSKQQITSLGKEEKLLHKTSLNSKDKDTVKDPILQSFLKERYAFVRGAIRQEGAYPVTEQSNLSMLLSTAGGIALEGNDQNIELTSRTGGRRIIDIQKENPADISITAGDTVRINQKFHKIAKQTVTIIGEVNHPGEYDLTAGDTLSQLLNRAGGTTEQAYAKGTIFSRASERKREQQRYQSRAQDLELKLAASMQQVDDDKKPDMAQVSATQDLISRLNKAKAVGRITVEAHPDSLRADKELDILLESGDKIYIPKRPMTVRVVGEVLSPAALQFRQSKGPLEYIKQAGGTTYHADKDRTFVIYPDGSAQPLKISAWNHEATFIPPGSTIIVPRDPKPFNFLESAGRVSQLLANLAISGLYIEAIGDD